MDMAGSLILIANPGSASRKYALYENERVRGELHFEWLRGRVNCTITRGDQTHSVPVEIDDLALALRHVLPLLQQSDILHVNEKISSVGLRIVAPGAYFLQDRLVDETFTARLEAAQTLAPLHVKATLQELYAIQQQFDVPIVGVSDSSFHATKPEAAWNYGLPLADADHFDIKRFGYHGLSAASVMRALSAIPHLGSKTIICHMGSGVSVAAIQDGKSLDTTMGYSPLDGVIMATRSGSIDWAAGQALKKSLRLSDAEFDTYLNSNCGLQGLGGSSDVRELLEREAHGDAIAHLALTTYIYNIQKAIGQMVAVLGGVDQFVFTGTIGERSAPVREQVMVPFEYINLVINKQANANCVVVREPVDISLRGHPIPIFVIPANESIILAQQTLQIMTQ
jgi:acetate kinase